MTEWENNLIDKTIKEQKDSFNSFTEYGVSHMDIPPQLPVTNNDTDVTEVV